MKDSDFGLLFLVALFVAACGEATEEAPPVLTVDTLPDGSLVFKAEPPGAYQFSIAVDDAAFTYEQTVDANVLTIVPTSAGCLTVTAYLDDIASNPVHACGKPQERS